MGQQPGQVLGEEVQVQELGGGVLLQAPDQRLVAFGQRAGGGRAGLGGQKAPHLAHRPFHRGQALRGDLGQGQGQERLKVGGQAVELAAGSTTRGSRAPVR